MEIGVAFVQSHDSSGSPPYLANVAYAYMLMRPGNAIVYFNANEFGTRANNFPQQGRGDSPGGGPTTAGARPSRAESRQAASWHSLASNSVAVWYTMAGVSCFMQR